MSTPNEPQNPYGSGEPQPPQDPSGAPQYPPHRRRTRSARPPRRRTRGAGAPPYPACRPARRSTRPPHPYGSAPGGYQQPGAGYGAGYVYPKNSLAVWSLVLGIVSFVLVVRPVHRHPRGDRRQQRQEGGRARRGEQRRHGDGRASSSAGSRSCSRCSASSCSPCCSRTPTSGTRSTTATTTTTDVATVDDGPQPQPTGPLPSDAPAPDGAGRRASLTAPARPAGPSWSRATVLLAVRDPHVTGSYGVLPAVRADRAVVPGVRRPAGDARPGARRPGRRLVDEPAVGARGARSWSRCGAAGSRARAAGSPRCGRRPAWAAWAAPGGGGRVRGAAQRPGARAVAGALTDGGCPSHRPVVGVTPGPLYDGSLDRRHDRRRAAWSGTDRGRR